MEPEPVAGAGQDWTGSTTLGCAVCTIPVVTIFDVLVAFLY